MAKAKYPTPSPELIGSVIVCPRAWVQWEGSSAFLLAEAVILEGFEWPQGGRYKVWDACGWHYWLERRRMPGVKGPWINNDWWRVQRSRSSDYGTGYAAASIYEKRRELECEVWRHSPDGARAGERYWKAHKDASFQAFKLRAIGRDA